MKGADLRLRHRQLGIVLAIFIIAQAATGIVMSVGQLTAGPNHEHGEQAAAGHAACPVEKGTHTHAEEASPGTTHDTGMGLSGDIVMTIHHGGGTIGPIYRMLLGTGLLIQTLIGVVIFIKIRQRSRSLSSRSQSPRTEGF